MCVRPSREAGGAPTQTHSASESTSGSTSSTRAANVASVKSTDAPESRNWCDSASATSDVFNGTTIAPHRFAAIHATIAS